MKLALISLLVITGMFTSLNGGALTKGVQNAKAIPAKATAKTRVDQGQPKVGTLKPADFGKFEDSAKGKVLVLNFWATWCGRCRRSSPTVALDAKYRDKGMKLVGITADDPDDVQPKVIPFIKKHQVKFDIIRQDTDDPEEMLNQITKDWNGVIPATFVYDKNGNLADIGASASSTATCSSPRSRRR